MRNSKLLRDKGIWAIVLIVIAMAVAMVCLPVGNDAAAALNVDEPGCDAVYRGGCVYRAVGHDNGRR